MRLRRRLRRKRRNSWSSSRNLPQSRVPSVDGAFALQAVAADHAIGRVTVGRIADRSARIGAKSPGAGLADGQGHGVDPVRDGGGPTDTAGHVHSVAALAAGGELAVDQAGVELSGIAEAGRWPQPAYD